MAFSQQLMSLKNGSKPANNPTTTVDILQPPPLIPDSSVGKNYIPKITCFFIHILCQFQTSQNATPASRVHAVVGSHSRTLHCSLNSPTFHPQQFNTRKLHSAIHSLPRGHAIPQVQVIKPTKVAWEPPKPCQIIQPAQSKVSNRKKSSNWINHCE